MNDIQYISITNKNKNIALKNKQNVNKTKCIFLKKDCSWQDIKTLVKKGCTISRVGTSSNFIVLDIDDSDVTHDEMRQFAKQNNDVFAVKSISGKEYKHHVYFFTKEYGIDENNDEQYKQLVKDCYDRLTYYFIGKRITLDKNAWSYWQCMYSYAEENSTFTLDNSIQLDRWCKKFEEPVAYIEKEDADEDIDEEDYSDIDEYLKTDPETRWCLIPNRAKEYMTMLLMNDYTANLYKKLPFQLVKHTFIKNGYRHNSLFKLTNIVCVNAFVCRFFGLEYSDYDIVKTIEHYVVRYYENGEQLWHEEENHVWDNVIDIMNNLLDKYESFGMDNSIEALIITCPTSSHRYGFESYIKNRLSKNFFDVFSDVDEYVKKECINYYGSDEHILDCRKIFNRIMKEIHLNVLKTSYDEDEQKRVYELTKDVQLFNDMPVETMSFDDFKNKSTVGMNIEVENKTLKLEHKQHKQHKNKGKCIENYKLENNIVYIPRSKIKPAICKYCSKNGIKICRT